jgi:hypothetical protein
LTGGRFDGIEAAEAEAKAMAERQRQCLTIWRASLAADVDYHSRVTVTRKMD